MVSGFANYDLPVPSTHKDRTTPPPSPNAVGNGKLGNFDKTFYIVSCTKSSDAITSFGTSIHTFMDGSEFMKDLQGFDQACDGKTKFDVTAISRPLIQIGPTFAKELTSRFTKQMDTAICNGMRMASQSSCSPIGSYNPYDPLDPATWERKKSRTRPKSRSQPGSITRERRVIKRINSVPTMHTASCLEQLEEITVQLAAEDAQDGVERKTSGSQPISIRRKRRAKRRNTVPTMHTASFLEQLEEITAHLAEEDAQDGVERKTSGSQPGSIV